jgi:hypothetical protein
MASLEFIRYVPHQPVIASGTVRWAPVSSERPVERLPQIFWTDGTPWREVNLWALEMGRNREMKIKTVHSLIEHLHKFANWLEQAGVDWRHFPQTKADRVLVRYRGALVDNRDCGALSPSTTTARIGRSNRCSHGHCF